MGNNPSFTQYHQSLHLLKHSKSHDESLFITVWNNITTASDEEFFALFDPTFCRHIFIQTPQVGKHLLKTGFKHFVSSIQSKSEYIHVTGFLRLLLRILPFLFEFDGSNTNSSLTDSLFWEKAPLNNSNQNTESTVESLGSQIICGVLQCCFLENFTVYSVPVPIDSSTGTGMYAWNSIHPNSTTSYTLDLKTKCILQPVAGEEFLKNRLLVLQTLLVLISTPIFHPSDSFIPNKFFQQLCCCNPFVLTVFIHSLFNCILSWTPNSGVFSVPFIEYAVKDSQKDLAHFACLFLAVLSCSEKNQDNFISTPEGSSIVRSSCSTLSNRPTNSALKDPISRKNLFFKLLSQYPLPHDPTFQPCSRSSRSSNNNSINDSISSNSDNTTTRTNGNSSCTTTDISNLFSSLLLVLQSVSAYGQDIKFHQEFCFLMYKIIEINISFRSFVISNSNNCFHLYFTLLNIFNHLKSQGSLHSGIMILYILSVNKPFSQTLCSKFNIPPTYFSPISEYPIESFIDLFYKKILNQQSIWQIAFVFLLNISPSIHHLSIETCTQLIGIFEFFTDQSQSLSSIDSPKYVQFCIELFNNFAYYGGSRLDYFWYLFVTQPKLLFNCTHIFSEKLSLNNNPNGDKEASNNKSQSNTFVPTPLWEREWKKKLDITVLTTISSPIFKLIQPQLHIETPLVISTRITQLSFSDYIKRPKRIFFRSYTQTNSIRSWQSAYCWGLVYNSFSNLPVFSGTHPILFKLPKKRRYRR